MRTKVIQFYSKCKQNKYLLQLSHIIFNFAAQKKHIYVEI
jgi:hypothetical protein